MKKYLAAVALGTLIAPALGATIYGILLGNPFIIFAPAVLPVAYIVEGIPFIIFGIIGCVIHSRLMKSGRMIAAKAAVAYGLIMGTLCALAPLLIVVEHGRWELNQGIVSFLTTGGITGMVCAILGSWMLNKMDSANKGLVRTGDPRTVRQSAQP